MEILKIIVESYEILINEEDYEKLGKPDLLIGIRKTVWPWQVYTVRFTYEHKTVNLHRMIIGEGNIPKGFEVDHKDRNPLNNVRSNLRIATKSQNNINRSQKTGVSGQRGVYWDKRRNWWVAKIVVEGKQIQLCSTTSKDYAI